MDKKDMLIIGAGPAGLTAALYCRRYGLSCAVIEKLVEGGQLATTPIVENYPGVADISGFELAQSMKKQAEKAGAEFINSEVISVDFSGNEKKLTLKSGELIGTTVIIATGAKRRKLGCKGEDSFAGRGVSYCATCDGAFFRGKTVLVVGGGNTALEDALFLSGLCEKVYLVHRRDEMRGMKALVSAVTANEKIEVLYSTQLVEISGEMRVSSVTIESAENRRTLAVDGVFIAIGTQPDNDAFKEAINLDESGYIIAAEDCKTNVDGVYAAGDSRKKPLRQIVTATADGATAAFEAASYINQL